MTDESVAVPGQAVPSEAPGVDENSTDESVADEKTVATRSRATTEVVQLVGRPCRTVAPDVATSGQGVEYLSPAHRFPPAIAVEASLGEARNSGAKARAQPTISVAYWPKTLVRPYSSRLGYDTTQRVSYPGTSSVLRRVILSL